MKPLYKILIFFILIFIIGIYVAVRSINSTLSSDEKTEVIYVSHNYSQNKVIVL